MELPQIDVIAALVATAASVVLGFAWFSPMLFQRIWLAGIPREEFSPNLFNAVVLLITTFGMALGVGVVYAWVEASGWDAGIEAGVFLYALTILPLKLADTFLERRPMSHFWVTAGFQLLSFALMGLITGLMS